MTFDAAAIAALAPGELFSLAGRTAVSVLVAIPSGVPVRSSDGGVVFEIGRGLYDPRAAYSASEAR